MRALIGLVVAGLVSTASAQPAEKIWRVGNVNGVSAAVAKPYEDAFLAGMRERGYVVGRNLVFDTRYADGDPSRYRALIDEVIALKPDVLIGANTAVSKLMKTRTKKIPIVLATSGDPVGDRLVESLSRPGGNVTGVSLQLGEFGGKHVELIAELLPGLRSICVLADNSGDSLPQIEEYGRRAGAAAKAKGVEIRSYRIDRRADLEQVFREMSAARPDALLAFLSPRLNSLRHDIIGRTAGIGLPAIAHHEGFAQDGGLMSFGPSFVEGWRRVPYFVDRIFKGAQPAELPIEQPTKFLLLINAKTAKALGITIPKSILLRADRVVE